MVECNFCMEEFEIKELEKEVLKDVERTYFTCPHCKEEFTVTITDARLRGLIQRKKELDKEIQKRETYLMRKYL